MLVMRVTWVEPVKDTKWGPAAAELRTRPGEWGGLEDVGANVHQYANSIRHGKIVAFRPAGQFEARVVNGVLQARYVGPPPDQES